MRVGGRVALGPNILELAADPATPPVTPWLLSVALPRHYHSSVIQIFSDSESNISGFRNICEFCKEKLSFAWGAPVAPSGGKTVVFFSNKVNLRTPKKKI